MLVLRPYFPNQRRQYALSDRSKFSWFLCGTKYYDKKLKTYVVLLPKGTLLYSEKSGKTYEVAADKVSLVLGSEAENYNGTASVKDCIPSDNPVWCKEATIKLPKKLLKVVPVDRCKVVQYAKMNNSAIRQKLPSFPTCKQIDKSLEIDSSNCHKVSKDLSQAIDKLFIAK